MAGNVVITYKINDKLVKREDVFSEELKRSKIAMERLGVHVDSDDLGEIRKALVARKMELGHEKIKHLCASDTKKAAFLTGMLRVFSFGKVKPCRMEVYAKGISAKEFIEWFEETNAKADESSLVYAHPEHYIIHNTPDGCQEIYETSGGAPCTAHFVIDFSDKEDALK